MKHVAYALLSLTLVAVPGITRAQTPAPAAHSAMSHDAMHSVATPHSQTPSQMAATHSAMHSAMAHVTAHPSAMSHAAMPSASPKP